MLSAEISGLVARQYTEWCYPLPIADMRQAISNGYYEFGVPCLFLPLLWPVGHSLQGMRILVAGCGTNQAAYQAIAHPDAIVVGIDLSLTSLQHEQYLKDKHQLDNLSLYQMSLLDVKKLNCQFDLIISTGVLHHLPDPDAGLSALREVLLPDGLMQLMVYGTTLRMGVYMLQNVFERLGLKQTSEDVALVRQTLASMPPWHCIHAYIREADDLHYDSGVVDTFLHPQDRSYTVPEILEFARRNGLAFWDWEDRINYSASAAIPANHPLFARIMVLPLEERWAVIELLTQVRGTHRFMLCHSKYATTAVRIDFEHGPWLQYVPVIRPCLSVVEAGDLVIGKHARLKRLWHEFNIPPSEVALMKYVDGRNTISHILLQAQNDIPGLLQEEARSFFDRMQDQGHLMYWASPSVLGHT